MNIEDFINIIINYYNIKKYLIKMIDNSNLLSPNIINQRNLQDDSNIRRIQQNLIMMGFDIIMINKIISFYKIRSEDEALDYLIKTEDGMWNHPFIPKEINSNEDNNNRILEQPKVMMNNVLTRINTLGLSNSLSQQNIINKNNEPEHANFQVYNDICEICGESKDVHKIKEYIIPTQINTNNNNNKIITSYNDIINNNMKENIFQFSDVNINLFNDEEENKLLINGSNINNNIQNNIEYNNEIDYQKEEEDINPNECPICMGELENPVEIEKCKHKFCQECFNNYLVNLISINRIDQIPCPKNKCPNKKLSEEFFSQFLSEQEYFKYHQFKAQNEIAKDSKKIFCPLCDSYASIDGLIEKYDSNNPNYKKSTLKCQKGHEFCSCGRPLHENECYHDEKEFKEFLTKEKIKKCPKCGFLIKKGRGCNHMTCGNPICRYEFCWLCMKEAVRNHYDYGPCAGKQFFDPDSFSYKLSQSHPCLYCIYSLFECIFRLFFFILAFILVPGIGFSIIAYKIIIENNSLTGVLNQRYLKYMLFMICVFMGFSLQNLIYYFWGIIFSILILIISLLIMNFVKNILINILRFIFCCSQCNKKDDNNDINIDIGPNDIEFGNNINEHNENINNQNINNII